MAGKPPESMDSQGESIKRKNSNDGGAIPKKVNTTDADDASGGSIPSTQANKTSPSTELSLADKHLKALTSNFLDNCFELDRPIDAESRELLLRFGFDVYKYISEKEAVSSVQILAKQMHEGFNMITSKLEYLHGQVTDLQSGKQEEKIKEAGKASYADMTKKLETIKPKDEEIEPQKTKLVDPNLAKKFTVLELKDKVDDEGFQEVRSKLTKKLMGRKVRVDKILKTSNGNVSLEYPTVDDQQKVEQILKEYKPPGANIRSSTVRQVAIALRGIPKYLSAEEVKADLVAWNSEHPFGFGNNEGWTLRLLQPADKRSRFQVGKIIAPINRAKTLLNENFKVYVALTALRVELWKPNHSRCAKCFRSDHVASQCSNETMCVICGGDHSKDSCSKKDRPESFACVVCVRQQKKDFKHMATNKDCPILLGEQMLEYKKVYNYVHHG